jgi:uracil phosphoribosyltransferase
MRPYNCTTVVHDRCAQTELSRWRDKNTKPGDFRRLTRGLYRKLIQEVVSREFPTKQTSVTTPMSAYVDDAIATSAVIDPSTEVVILNLLRGGDIPSNICSEALDEYLDQHRTDFLGISRVSNSDGHVQGAEVSYRKLGNLDDKILLIPDCMGATGSTITQALKQYTEGGLGRPKKILCLNLIITSFFAEKLSGLGLPLHIYTYSVDRRLTDKSYIVPGAGDVGERLTGLA